MLCNIIDYLVMVVLKKELYNFQGHSTFLYFNCDAFHLYPQTSTNPKILKSFFNLINSRSSGGSFMVQKMAISSLSPPLTLESAWFVYGPENGDMFSNPRPQEVKDHGVGFGDGFCRTT